jgi:hypothetical protein
VDEQTLRRKNDHQLNNFFDTLTTALVDGKDNDNKGLKQSLNEAVDRCNKAQREAVWSAMQTQ